MAVEEVVEDKHVRLRRGLEHINREVLKQCELRLMEQCPLYLPPADRASHFSTWALAFCCFMRNSGLLAASQVLHRYVYTCETRVEQRGYSWVSFSFGKLKCTGRLLHTDTEL
jgi:hypothetical protein